ncbi:MAG: hypothetical protein FD118_4115 [Rhodocyclaceae bacterium]|nr:MAG: hypothetical protein FD118_4115 [Rhodocyclaceae bacterium]
MQLQQDKFVLLFGFLEFGQGGIEGFGLGLVFWRVLVELVDLRLAFGCQSGLFVARRGDGGDLRLAFGCEIGLGIPLLLELPGPSAYFRKLLCTFVARRCQRRDFALQGIAPLRQRRLFLFQRRLRLVQGFDLRRLGIPLLLELSAPRARLGVLLSASAGIGVSGRLTLVLPEPGGVATAAIRFPGWLP